MLKIKRKRDRFLNASRIFAIHVAFYITFVVLYWWVFVSEINYPGNATVPRGVFAQNSIERLNYTLIWGLIVLLHFAVVLTLNWKKNRQIAQVDQNIRWDDDAFVASSRLEADAEEIAQNELTNWSESSGMRDDTQQQ